MHTTSTGQLVVWPHLASRRMRCLAGLGRRRLGFDGGWGLPQATCCLFVQICWFWEQSRCKRSFRSWDPGNSRPWRVAPLVSTLHRLTCRPPGGLASARRAGGHGGRASAQESRGPECVRPDHNWKPHGSRSPVAAFLRAVWLQLIKSSQEILGSQHAAWAEGGEKSGGVRWQNQDHSMGVGGAATQGLSGGSGQDPTCPGTSMETPH